MQVSIAQVQNILKGNHAFSQLGFSMLITRLKGIYAKEPSPTTLQKCADEINAFLAKFSSIMSQDFAVITSL